MNASRAEAVIRARWLLLARGDESCEGLLPTILNRYAEPQRRYHTCTHIAALLEMSEARAAKLRDRDSVDMAIVFHDIVYDPRAPDNEEQSAALFERLMSGFLSEDVVKKVVEYILQTKKHEVAESADSDLQLFIDMDMSILGSEFAVYKQYAQAIRQEYCHVPTDVYCTSRGAFLKRMLTSGVDTVFATREFRDLMGAQVRANLEWECALLEQGEVPVSSAGDG